jgi:2-dehydropantoate 2-reductase
MKIMVFGAGAIGSLFGAFLSKNHDVILIGRPSHAKAIQKNGLEIIGKTRLNVKPRAESSVKNIDFSPDLLIITVKSYDTEVAIKQAKKIIDEKTIVMSLQNGLDNIDVLKKYVDCKKIIAGITTHGVFFSKPGVIEHTGFGDTTIGELDGKTSVRVKNIVKELNRSGIKTDLSKNITEDIWVKAVVNSSINPLTTIFQCKNGYLLENPVLHGIVEKVCYESCMVGKNIGLSFSYREILDKTVDVINKTSNNHSSMLQSVKNRKKTEIESINGKIVEIGGRYGVDVFLNKCLVFLVNAVNLK